MEKGESVKFEFHKELIGTIEHLSERRTAIERQMQDDETQKRQIEQDVNILQKRLTDIEFRLEKNNDVRRRLDKILQDTDTAYQRIYESSQALITAVRKQAGEITADSNKSSPPTLTRNSIKRDYRDSS